MRSPRPLQDNISRCTEETYSNIYQVNDHWDVKKVSRPSFVCKDTLELAQEQIKKEALESLRQTKKYLIVQNGFMRIGKYVFMGVVFPPYFIVYAIPKWIFMVAMPSLISVIAPIYDAYANRLKNGAKIIVNGMTLVEQSIRNCLNILISPIMRLGLDIKNAMKRFSDRVDIFLNRIINRAKNFSLHRFRFKSSLKEKYLQFPRLRQIADFMQKGMLATAQKMIIHPFHISIEAMKNGVEWFRVRPKQVAVDLFHFTLGRAFLFKSELNSRFQMSRKHASDIINLLEFYLKPYASDVKYVLNRVHFVYSKYIYPILAYLQQGLKSRLRKIGSFLDKKGDLFEQRIEAFLRILKDASNKKRFHFSFNWLPARFRNRALSFFSHPLNQRLIQVTLKSLHGFLNFLWTIILKTFKAMVRGMTVIMQVIARGIGFFKKSLGWGLNHLHRFGLSIIRRSGSGLRKTLVFILVLIYLTIWGFHVINRITNKLFPKATN